jgi:hypothetical protein
MKRFFLSTMVVVASFAWAGCDEDLSSITGHAQSRAHFREHSDQYFQHDRFERWHPHQYHTDAGRTP